MENLYKRRKLDTEADFNFDNPNTDNPNLNPKILSSHCSLCIAALEGNLSEVQSLFSKNRDTEMAATQTQTALHCSAFKGDLEIVKYLVEESDKNYIEKTNEQNFTALTIAIWYGYEEIVKFLTEKGANIHRQVYLYEKEEWGKWHHTVLNIAAWRGRTSIVDFLLDKRVNIENPPTFKGFTPLMTACHRKHLETVALLLKYGADVNVNRTGTRIRDNWTALHAAIRKGCLYIVQLLVENGMDLDQFGKDAIAYANENHHVEIKEYLKMKMEFYKWVKSSRGETSTGGNSLQEVCSGVVTKKEEGNNFQDDNSHP